MRTQCGGDYILAANYANKIEVVGKYSVGVIFYVPATELRANGRPKITFSGVIFA